MLRVLGAAVAAVSVALAGSASAATFLDRFNVTQGAVTTVYATPSNPLACNHAASCFNISGARMESKESYTLIQRPWDPGQRGDWADLLVWAGNSGSGFEETLYVGFNVNGVDYKTYYTVGASPPWHDLFKFSITAPEPTSVVRMIFGSDGPYGPNVSSAGGSWGAIPEPATWAMMIVGFGLTGAIMRRRRPALAA